jgi:hypothetical protein
MWVLRAHVGPAATENLSSSCRPTALTFNIHSLCIPEHMSLNMHNTESCGERTFHVFARTLNFVPTTERRTCNEREFCKCAFWRNWTWHNRKCRCLTTEWLGHFCAVCHTRAHFTDPSGAWASTGERKEVRGWAAAALRRQIWLGFTSRNILMENRILNQSMNCHAELNATESDVNFLINK